MTTTTMRFGPEWMRKQPASAKPLATSPPPSGTPGGNSNGGTPVPPGTASYSALVTPHAPPVQGKRDIAHPFKYSRDEVLQVFKDLGGASELPIEVERWEGIVRESAGDPVSLGDLTEVEKKLYTSSLNSEMRRRQTSDYSGQSERSKGGTLNSGLGLMGRRRRGDSSGADHPPLSLPRKTSWSSATGNLASPSAASPRTRMSSGSGIDGILNGSDTAWGGGKRRTGPGQHFPDRLDEEEETQKDPDSLKSKEVTDEPAEISEGTEIHRLDEQDPPGAKTDTPQHTANDVNRATTSVNKLSLNTDKVASQNSNQADIPGRNAVDTTDLSNVEWSYIDPSGNVQGPFSGETMQRWNDQQYFTDHLMMKRTKVDAEFIPLAEIKRRAQGDRIFLSPLSTDGPPPGLGHFVPGIGANPLLQRSGITDAPSQPSPLSYGRNAALESFINAGSNATASGSPSSSLGGSLARGNLSPDPIAVGGRPQRLASDAALNGRASAAGSYSSNGSPAVPQSVRQIFNEPPQPNRSSSFDVPVPWQIPEGTVVPGWNGPSDGSHLSQPGQFDQMTPSAFGHNQIMRDAPAYTIPAGPTSVDTFLTPSLPAHRFYGQSDALGSPFHQIPHEPSQFEGAQQQPSLPQLNSGLNRAYEQQAPSPTVASNFQSQVHTRQAPPPSPWGATQQREPPRPRPFDAEQPTSNNTFVVSLPQPSAWNRPQPDVRPKDSWSSTQQSILQDTQGQLTQEPQSLTIANVNQHNERQNHLDSQNKNAPHAAASQSEAPPRTPNDEAATAVTPVTENQASVTLASHPSEAPPQPPRPAPKRKASTAPAASAAEKAQPASGTSSSKTSATPPKAAWAKDDEGKFKPSAAPMTLRDIQEQEKKRQEALKKAEKERERAARAASSTSPTEEVQFTASWGLPTSQVGARGNGAGAAKEASPVSPASTTPAPVWSNAAKPAAKTMKEIQEEEERRKQAVKERETAATAAKRAVQAPTIKAPALNVQSTGGPWTVVGAGGKSQTAASLVAARPSAAAQASSPSVQTAPSRPAASQRTASSPAVSKTASSNAKAEDEASAPSLEFMKWMRESLRGLNSSVQFEEIAQMLLSFPLDPDKATKEIIAETVYGASTTLNGHDFAEEFIKKRKEDALLSRTKGGTGQAASGKSVSLADVVKAQPKPPQNDFGAFKVVKKKNKRS